MIIMQMTQVHKLIKAKSNIILTWYLINTIVSKKYNRTG